MIEREEAMPAEPRIAPLAPQSNSIRRRDALKSCIAAAAALVAPAWLGGPARAQGGGRGATVTEDVARWLVALRYEDLPPEVIARAKRVLLDTIGCALGAIGATPV